MLLMQTDEKRLYFKIFWNFYRDGLETGQLLIYQRSGIEVSVQHNGTGLEA